MTSTNGNCNYIPTEENEGTAVGQGWDRHHVDNSQVDMTITLASVISNSQSFLSPMIAADDSDDGTIPPFWEGSPLRRTPTPSSRGRGNFGTMTTARREFLISVLEDALAIVNDVEDDDDGFENEKPSSVRTSKRRGAPGMSTDLLDKKQKQ